MASSILCCSQISTFAHLSKLLKSRSMVYGHVMIKAIPYWNKLKNNIQSNRVKNLVKKDCLPVRYLASVGYSFIWNSFSLEIFIIRVFCAMFMLCMICIGPVRVIKATLGLYRVRLENGYHHVNTNLPKQYNFK